jgi:hypothetical protein
MGLGAKTIGTSAECVPTEDFEHVGFSAVGEVYAHGHRWGKGGRGGELERLREGDVAAMVVDFDKRRVTWYRNEHPVAYYEPYKAVEGYPSFVMGGEGGGEGGEGVDFVGHKDYSVTLVTLQAIPHGLKGGGGGLIGAEVMMWDKRAKSQSTLVSNGLLTAKSAATDGYAAARTSAAFSYGEPFFEVCHAPLVALKDNR